MLETLLPPQSYFSISEVSERTQIKPHVIRYWESRFGCLRPARRESGQRKFTQREIAAILRIKELLYERGFTISGAKQFLKQEARRGTTQLKLDLGGGDGAEAFPRTLETIRDVRKDLEEALRLLKS